MRGNEQRAKEGQLRCAPRTRLAFFPFSGYSSGPVGVCVCFFPRQLQRRMHQRCTPGISPEFMSTLPRTSDPIVEQRSISTRATRVSFDSVSLSLSFCIVLYLCTYAGVFFSTCTERYARVSFFALYLRPVVCVNARARARTHVATVTKFRSFCGLPVTFGITIRRPVK